MGKRVAQVVTQAELGGAQKHIVFLCEELVDRGYEVDVFAAPGKWLKEELDSKGINFIEVPSMVREISFAKDLKTLFSLYRIFKKRDYDVVHCHSSKAGLLARIAARLAKTKKIVFTAHGFVFNEPMSELKRKIYIFLEKVGAVFGHEIITVSKKDYDCALEYKLANKNNLIYIPNAIEKVDKEDLREPEELKNQLGIDDEFIIGTVANFYETKGHVYLIEAVKRLYDEGYKFKTLFVGAGILFDEMKELCRGYSGFNFLGSRKDNYDLINIFDVFVLPSIKEGMPITVLEAMTLKKPVLCTKVGSLTDMIHDNLNGFIVESKSSEELYNRLKWILENKTVLNEVGENGYKYVEENFTMDKFMKDVLNVYNRG